MTIGASLFLLAAGAILKFAVKDQWDAIDLPTVGLILMIIGAVGLVIGLWQLQARRDDYARALDASRPRGPNDPPPPPNQGY